MHKLLPRKYKKIELTPAMTISIAKAISQPNIDYLQQEATTKTLPLNEHQKNQ
jgi:hypothetical protein